MHRQHIMYWTLITHYNILFASSTITKTGNSVTDKTRVQRSHSKLTVTITTSQSRVDITPSGSWPRAEGAITRCVHTCVLWQLTQYSVRLSSRRFLVWYIGFKRSISSYCGQQPPPTPSPTIRPIPIDGSSRRSVIFSSDYLKINYFATTVFCKLHVSISQPIIKIF